MPLSSNGKRSNADIFTSVAGDMRLDIRTIQLERAPQLRTLIATAMHLEQPMPQSAKSERSTPITMCLSVGLRRA
jgi:hypothetical protein